MKNIITFSVFIVIVLALTTCKENDPNPTVSNLTGSLSYQSKTFNIRGGQLDEDIYSPDKSRHSVRFKISDQPIEKIEDSLVMYFSSTEFINLDFILTTTDNGSLASGVYQFQDTSKTGGVLHDGLVLHDAYASFGTGAGPTSGGTSYTVKSGTISLTGTFPEYKVGVDFTLDNGGIIAGAASGVFITRATWSQYFH